MRDRSKRLLVEGRNRARPTGHSRHALSSLPASRNIKDSSGRKRKGDGRRIFLFNQQGTGGAVAYPDLSEPTRMDVQAAWKPDGAYSHTDVYFVQRLGKVLRYDGAARRVDTMGTIPTRGVHDNGLMGLALHPDFARNRWMYFWVSPPEMVGQNRQLRLLRVTATADHRLDLASQKILINIVGSRTDTWHSGGPMQFDRHGDLWKTLVAAERSGHQVSWHSQDGRLLHRISGQGRVEYRLPEMQRRLGLGRGIYLLRVRTARGLFTRARTVL